MSDAETTRDAAHQDREIGLESLGVALVRSVGGPFADLALDLARDDRPGQEPGERRGVERGVHGCVTYDADHCPGCAAAATRDGHDRADVEREP